MRKKIKINLYFIKKNDYIFVNKEVNFKNYKLISSINNKNFEILTFSLKR